MLHLTDRSDGGSSNRRGEGLSSWARATCLRLKNVSWGLPCARREPAGRERRLLIPRQL